MPTTPPGNKQIGDLTVIAVHGALTNDRTVTGKLLEGLVIVKDSTNTNVGLPPKNIFLGDITPVAVAGAKFNAQTINAKLLQALVVVKYAPPNSMQAKLLQSLVVVQQDSIATPNKPANLMIGDLGAIAVVGNNSTDQTVSCKMLQVLVVVKEFHPRKEVTTFNIEYAADAHFNVELNQ